MSASIKEALAALDAMPAFCELDTVRVALEASAQEAEAWEAIEAWIAADNDCLRRLGLQRLALPVSMQWEAQLFYPVGSGSMGSGSTKRFQRSTRLEALTKAGEWCRAELAK